MTPLPRMEQTADSPIPTLATPVKPTLRPALAMGLVAAGVVVSIPTLGHTGSTLGVITSAVSLVAGASLLVSCILGGWRRLDFSCPACGFAQSFANEMVEDAQPVPCRRCLGYLVHAKGRMHVVPAGHVAHVPVFEAPMPLGEPIWGERCTICDSTPCETEVVRRRGHGGGARATGVPVCHHHRGQLAVALAPARHLAGAHGLALRFRSYHAALAFRASNPTDASIPDSRTFDSV